MSLITLAHKAILSLIFPRWKVIILHLREQASQVIRLTKPTDPLRTIDNVLDDPKKFEFVYLDTEVRIADTHCLAL